MDRSILIVDDAATVRSLIRMKLAACLPGYSFHQAANGLEALEEIVRDPPRAVILDVNMPMVHGAAVLLLVKNITRRAPSALMRDLHGGAHANGARLAIDGIDAESLDVSDPFHPRRGHYSDPELDRAVIRHVENLEWEYERDLEFGGEAMKISAIPPYLIGELLGRPALRAIPILMLTTLADERERKRFERLGPPDAFLAKPFDGNVAATKIGELVRRSPAS